MIFHENRLPADDLADDSHELSRLIIFEKSVKFEIVVC